MGIKLNGVEITSNKLNSSDVTLEKLDGVKVWPTIVMAEIWKQTTNTNYTTELELYVDLGDPIYDDTYQGCATPSHLLARLDALRPATSETVGTIIRVSQNLSLALVGGGIMYCPTYMYYEAIIKENEWVFIFYSSSSNDYVVGQTGSSILIEGNFGFGGDLNLMQDYITDNYPPSNYDVGRVIIVKDHNDGYFYYFQLGQN